MKHLTRAQLRSCEAPCALALSVCPSERAVGRLLAAKLAGQKTAWRGLKRIILVTQNMAEVHKAPCLMK